MMIATQGMQRRSWRRAILAGIFTLAVATVPVQATTRDTVQGPVAATVIRVIDGDTIAVRARVWPGHEVAVDVRIDGVDAPELRGKCPQERALAQAARAFLDRRTAAREVRLTDIRFGKFAGRVVARVADADGRDLGDALTAAGLARPYGGGQRSPWCAEARATPR